MPLDGVSFAEIVMTSQFACGAVPRAFDAQQQDRAVHAYCAEWRETQGKLNADQMNKRVLFRLEKLYPAVFPECRPTTERIVSAGLTPWYRAYDGRVSVT
jgi:hypothetical protein